MKILRKSSYVQVAAVFSEDICLHKLSSLSCACLNYNCGCCVPAKCAKVGLLECIIIHLICWQLFADIQTVSEIETQSPHVHIWFWAWNQEADSWQISALKETYKYIYISKRHMKQILSRAPAAFFFHSYAYARSISPAILRFALGRHCVTCT